MSNKIKQQIADADTKHVIKDAEIGYLNDLDTVQRSFTYYVEQLKTNYLQQVAVGLGYDPKEKYEFSIDLKDPKKELTVKKI